MTIWEKIRLARRHIGPLAELLANPVYVEDMSEEWLATLGVQAIILDHDGVLGPNRSHGPDQSGAELIQRAVDVFGPGMVFVLSNTKSRKDARSRYYAENLPDVIYLSAKSKPDPDGLIQASWATGAAIESLAMLDDGPLTGILMALENGAVPVYARRRSLSESPMAMAARIITTWPQIIIVRILEALYLVN